MVGERRPDDRPDALVQAPPSFADAGNAPIAWQRHAYAPNASNASQAFSASQ
jgi:hypothetical protein